jgi:hypothetical protein
MPPRPAPATPAGPIAVAPSSPDALSAEAVALRVERDALEAACEALGRLMIGRAPWALAATTPLSGAGEDLHSLLEAGQPFADSVCVTRALGSVSGQRQRAADRVLREVANRLRPVLRDDDVLGRSGGDEFVVVVSGRGGRRPAVPHRQAAVRRVAAAGGCRRRTLPARRQPGCRDLPRRRPHARRAAGERRHGDVRGPARATRGRGPAMNLRHAWRNPDGRTAVHTPAMSARPRPVTVSYPSPRPGCTLLGVDIRLPTQVHR